MEQDKKDLRALPPDPEYIPSKPGVEAAAPLDAQDEGLVKALVLAAQCAQIEAINPRSDEYVKAADARERAEKSLLSRLSSLRESVASLTAQRDAARDAHDFFLKENAILSKNLFETREERDAMRESLEHGCLQCGYVGPNPTKEPNRG